MNYFCDFLEEFSCKLAPVLQKGSLSFLFLCCRRKNEFTAEDFLFYTTGCALRVSCVCFPGEVRPLLCAYFAAAYCCITPHPFDSCGGIPQNAKMCKFWYGNPMAFVRKIYGKRTEWKFLPRLALRQKGGNCTEKIWQEYGKNTEFIRKGRREQNFQDRCWLDYNIYFAFYI